MQDLHKLNSTQGSPGGFYVFGPNIAQTICCEKLLEKECIHLQSLCVKRGFCVKAYIVKFYVFKKYTQEKVM